jgi:uncharacterized protein DUF2877
LYAKSLKNNSYNFELKQSSKSGTSIAMRENMTTSLLATDYSRPIQPLFEQTSRAGRIHSVFHKAMNIATLDDTMLAVLSNELPRMPNSVRLSPIMAEKVLRHVRPDLEIWIGDGRLLILAHNLSLHLPETSPWEPRPEITAYHWRHEAVAQHVRLLAHHLAEQPQWGGLAPLLKPLLLGQPTAETPLSRMALPMLRLLAKASWLQDIVGVEEAARSLAGLGPGLTPSGDDALAGFAAVMTLLSPQISVDAAARDHIAVAIASAARPRTTALSAVLLAYAARGEVAEQVGNLLLSLALPVESSKAVLHAADRVLAFGANSGGDTLLGMLLGLRALEGEIDKGGYYDHTGTAQT